MDLDFFVTTLAALTILIPILLVLGLFMVPYYLFFKVTTSAIKTVLKTDKE